MPKTSPGRDLEEPTKPCRKCALVKGLSFFAKSKTCVDGHRHICNTCDKVRKDAWRTLNKEHHRIKCRTWVDNNPEARRATAKKWRDNNIVYFGNRKRHVRQATPLWANPFIIEEAYELARLRTKLFGFPWHVDHIVPIKGTTVSGLHVENNLQVIPGRLNIQKGNYFAS